MKLKEKAAAYFTLNNIGTTAQILSTSKNVAKDVTSTAVETAADAVFGKLLPFIIIGFIASGAIGFILGWMVG